MDENETKHDKAKVEEEAKVLVAATGDIKRALTKDHVVAVLGCMKAQSHLISGLSKLTSMTQDGYQTIAQKMREMAQAGKDVDGDTLPSETAEAMAEFWSILGLEIEQALRRVKNATQVPFLVEAWLRACEMEREVAG